MASPERLDRSELRRNILLRLSVEVSGDEFHILYYLVRRML